VAERPLAASPSSATMTCHGDEIRIASADQMLVITLDGERIERLPPALDGPVIAGLRMSGSDFLLTARALYRVTPQPAHE
jgi:hypothetical protein